MSEKFEINPFDRSALTDYRQLAGRNDELRQIRFTIRKAMKTANRIKSILITGERGVGKTSFLNLIEYVFFRIKITFAIQKLKICPIQ